MTDFDIPLDLPTSLDPDTLIDFAQQQRLNMLVDVANDPKLKLLTLKNISDTAVSVKRIASDEKNSAADRDIALTITESLKNIRGNPYLIKNPIEGAKETPAPIIPDAVPRPGETSAELKTLKLDELT